MSTNRNIFRAGGDDTFAISVPILEKILSQPKHKDISTLLYVYLLSRADGPTFRVHIADIIEHTGMSRPTVMKARNALRDDLKMIQFTTEAGSKGYSLYELLNVNGGKLATFEDYVKFNELRADVIEAYYASRLNVTKAPGQDASGNLLFGCPFKLHTKSKPTLQVTINVGHQFHGRFVCGHPRCVGQHGGMVDFEQAMAEKRGRMISTSQAAQAVRSFVVGRMNGDHLPHPAVAGLMEQSEAAVI
jgi:hypothetical protein